MRAVELFAGAGGLAMGVSLAGFRSLAVVEWDKWACDTVRENQRRSYPLVASWPLVESDVRTADWSHIPSDIELLAGGPPCQPFSMGGKHKAHDDKRDMFPATVQIVRELRPKTFIVENVKGLTRSSFANYFEYIKLQLEFPEAPREEGESWFDHLMRLQTVKTSGDMHEGGLTYNVTATLVNAADYGVPQKRERVFIVGTRSDLGIDWHFPDATHSEDALIYSQWVTGEYWDRHEIASRARPMPPMKLSKRIEALKSSPPKHLPWRTVRDATVGLPDPRTREAKSIRDHKFQDGAKVYPGHTGSPLDQPAKTIKAGDHGVPGGENMMVLPDGSVRYFTARETARIQTFPDGYVFHGSWSETMRQLGNAVPVALGRVVASSVAEAIIRNQLHRIQTNLNEHKKKSAA
ncbi:multidrug DMT transporter [Achromobacter piechaudii]|uniref:DNA cytosine methyltransferase n=1 Tax=Achromobacter piechaudii TaxID=72556 RepID=UPI000680DE4D|nr:DNA cytosine methyltransferase [Achromobacter piechaudii]KNY09962.1 multidrug DMT transporter [Achromobacter piechaudii]